VTVDQKFDALQRVTGGVSRETHERMVKLERFFLKWAGTINLVATSTLEDTWTRHVLDSAQLWRYRAETACWLDLGSGSGFPALVLAVLSDDFGFGTTLVESNMKKCAYLRQAIHALGLRASVLSERVERIGRGAYEHRNLTITARAFTPLPRLLEWTNGLGSFANRGLIHKGRGYRSEVEEARSEWRFDLIEHRSIIDADSVILDITNVTRRQA